MLKTIEIVVVATMVEIVTVMTIAVATHRPVLRPGMGTTTVIRHMAELGATTVMHPLMSSNRTVHTIMVEPAIATPRGTNRYHNNYLSPMGRQVINSHHQPQTHRTVNPTMHHTANLHTTARISIATIMTAFVHCPQRLIFTKCLYCHRVHD